MKAIAKLQAGKPVPRELELELVGEKLRQLELESKRKGTKFETLEEVMKRYGFKW